MEAIMNVIYFIVMWVILAVLFIGLVSFLISAFKSLGSDKSIQDHQTTTNHSINITFQKKK
jgi:predicted secreted protein